jgi:low affinity Fe/Cu permease
MDDPLTDRGLFNRFAKRVSRRAGHPWAFYAAFGIIVVWGATGPLFGFSDTWQLVINTGTTIVTFLMVFLIQNAQTRDAEAIHIKLDELIEATKGARRELLDLEEMPEEELHRLQQGYEALAAEARRKHHGRRRDGRTRRPTPGVDEPTSRQRQAPRKRDRAPAKAKDGGAG